MSKEQNIPEENSKQEVNENNSSVPAFPEDKQAPIIEKPKTRNDAQHPADKPETEIMEVHAHTHTPRKKWTHYFWEFLMLFLAVFCGFIAENEREHFIERKRAEVLAESLYNDIVHDTAALQNVQTHTNNKLIHLDTLIQDLHRQPGTWNDTSVCRNIYWLVRFQVFERGRSTFDQLKSSGSMRYFKKELVKLLSEYDVIAQEIKLREDGEYSVLSLRVIPMCMGIINFEMVYTYSFNQPFHGNVYVKIKDRDKADYVAGEAAGVKIVRTRLKLLYEQQIKHAEAIIAYLKEHYRIK